MDSLSDRLYELRAEFLALFPGLGAPILDANTGAALGWLKAQGEFCVLTLAADLTIVLDGKRDRLRGRLSVRDLWVSDPRSHPVITQ